MAPGRLTRLALWGACVAVTTAQHYDDTRDGLWHVCSPAWAVPQLDDDSLNASVASERRVVMAVLRGYRQALACAQPA